MRASPKFQLPNNDAGRAQYIKMSEDYLAAMKAKLPEYFGILPKADLIVKRVEAFREEPGGAQHYFPANAGWLAAGHLLRPPLRHESDADLYAGKPSPIMRALPGHHMQISIAQELTGIPQFRTQYGYTAYQEGWGLYSEALAKDMGFYTDPYSDFGRLIAGDLARGAARGRHRASTPRAGPRSRRCSTSSTTRRVADGAVRSEVRRYFVWPGQATCYKIGMLQILELRALAQTRAWRQVRLYAPSTTPFSAAVRCRCRCSRCG